MKTMAEEMPPANHSSLLISQQHLMFPSFFSHPTWQKDVNFMSRMNQRRKIMNLKFILKEHNQQEEQWKALEEKPRLFYFCRIAMIQFLTDALLSNLHQNEKST
ncbi:hypothetical protein M9H77_21592 [Catharanthus roseus]|uniref:Uncharacterized protein n=1 Tax=Catharanthus roseus TaxID=4058 RepID=A0ACC0ANW2_CATRO|nr:hypothetical protein M9H77_21592 [Catharanthus roseus]